MKKIISGGQTGADIGGVAAGKEAGLETGGFMPPKFLTELGPRPDFADKYGFEEFPTKSLSPAVGYKLRTHANAEHSDGTIRFANDWNSRGEKCTLNAIEKNQKPYIDVDLEDPIDHNEVVAWIESNNIEVLNVAGNRESKCPGIGRFVTEYLLRVFKELDGESNC